MYIWHKQNPLPHWKGIFVGIGILDGPLEDIGSEKNPTFFGRWDFAICCSISQKLVDDFAHFLIGGGTIDFVLNDAFFVQNYGERIGITTTVALKEQIVLSVTAVNIPGIGGEIVINPFGNVNAVLFELVYDDDVDLITVILVKLGKFGF